MDITSKLITLVQGGNLYFVYACRTHELISSPTRLRASFRAEGSSSRAGYMLAQCAVPGMRIAGEDSERLVVLPTACQGSVVPCTNTTFVTLGCSPPYSIFVVFTPRSKRLMLNFGPKMSPHIFSKNLTGMILPQGCLGMSED